MVRWAKCTWCGKYFKEVANEYYSRIFNDDEEKKKYYCDECKNNCHDLEVK